MPYTLAYKDRFIRGYSPITGDVCENSIPFPYLAQEAPNRIVYEWTGAQITRMFSALKIGADLMFPEAANDIIWDFLKGLSCPPEVDPDGECIEYQPSASFIKYYPDSPFVDGDVATGWNKEAWFRWNQFDTLFPDWIDNWLGGLIDALTGYQEGDILFNFESVPIDPIDIALENGFITPRIEIQFSGSGVVEVSLLSFPLGGKAIIELDNEPNILDILTGGILDPAAFLVELNRDIFNFPPNEFPVINVEVPVTTAGNHTLYIVFIPIVDDALLPVGFGGGIRSIELCGFEEEGSAGVEQIIWDGCALKSITGGIETTIVTAAEIQACLDIPEPSEGGGNASTKATVKTVELGSNIDTTATSFQKATATAISHAFTKTNALLIAQVLHRNLVASGSSNLRVGIEGFFGASPSTQRLTGDSGGISTVSQLIEGPFVAEPQEIAIWHNQSGGGTSRISSASTIRYTILEFEDISELFVEDVREIDGVLQKKIAGVWLDVMDIQALTDAAQATANASLALANSAIATNTTQATQIANIIAVNNTQNSRLNAIEADLPDIELSLSQHESRLDALEAAGAGIPTWIQEYDFTAASYDWTGASWVSGSGFVFSGDLNLILPTKSVSDSRVLWVEIRTRRFSLPSLLNSSALFGGGSNFSNIKTSSPNLLNFNWIKVGNLDFEYVPSLFLEDLGANTRLEYMRIVGVGNYNPFS